MRSGVTLLARSGREDRLSRLSLFSSREPGAILLPADDEGLDVVPAVTVRGLRDAVFELGQELREETVGAVLALERECTEEERLAPCGDAPDVVPREHGGIFIPVGVVETEGFGALELEAGEGPAARLEGGPDLVERAHPHRNDNRGDGGGADAPRAAPVG